VCACQHCTCTRPISPSHRIYRFEPGDVAVMHPRNPRDVVVAIASALLRPVAVDGEARPCHGISGLPNDVSDATPAAVERLLSTRVVVSRVAADSVALDTGGPLCGVPVTVETILAAWLDLTAVPRRVWLEQAALRATDPEQRDKCVSSHDSPPFTAQSTPLPIPCADCWSCHRPSAPTCTTRIVSRSAARTRR